MLAEVEAEESWEDWDEEGPAPPVPVPAPIPVPVPVISGSVPGSSSRHAYGMAPGMAYVLGALAPQYHHPFGAALQLGAIRGGGGADVGRVTPQLGSLSFAEAETMLDGLVRVNVSQMRNGYPPITPLIASRTESPSVCRPKMGWR